MVCSNIVIGRDVPYWTCGQYTQCCLLCMWDVYSNIVIGLTYWTCGQCMFVMYVGRMF